MAATWIQFDPSELYPDELASVAEVCQSTAETLAIGVRFLADATRVAAVFAQSFTDLNKALIESTQALIDAAVQQLQSGIYWTFHIPGSFTQKLTPTRWLSELAYSFDDRMDPERPILPTKQFVGALVLCGTTESYPLLIENFRALFDLFNKFIATEEQTQHWQDPGSPWDVIPGIGQAPNWGNMILSDLVPPIGDLVRTLLGFRDQISAASSNLLDEYATFLDLKADQLEDISNKLDEILQQLENFLNFEGAWLLPIYGEFDTDDIQLILTNSIGGPLDVEGANYTGGCMFLAAGGLDPQTAADNLFDLFGVPKETTELPDVEDEG
jgi:hypothetical protein